MKLRALRLGGLLLILLVAYLSYGTGPAGTAAAADCAGRQLDALNHGDLASGDVPVLFVHGITGSPAIWTTRELDGAPSIANRIGSIAGTSVWAFDYHQWSEDWVTNAHIGPALAAAITCLANATGKRVILVAHSMGGLAIQFAAAQQDGSGNVADRIAEVIAIGTPYKGSKLLSAVQLAVVGGEDLADPEVTATAEALLSACAGISEVQLAPGNGNPCGILSVLRAPIGSALEYDSPEIAALPAWSARLPVKDIDGNIDVSIEIAKLYRHTFDIGDILVSPDSATAHNTDGRPDNIECARVKMTTIVTLRSACYHSRLPRNQTVVDYVAKLVSQLVARQRSAEPERPATRAVQPAVSTPTLHRSTPTCGQYEQMTDPEKEHAIEVMQAAHHDPMPAIVARASVGLFCRVYPDHTIDGVYDGNL